MRHSTNGPLPDPHGTRRRRRRLTPALWRAANPRAGSLGLMPAVLLVALALATLLWIAPPPGPGAQSAAQTVATWAG